MRTINKIICFLAGHKHLVHDLPITVKLIPRDVQVGFYKTGRNYILSDESYSTNEVIIGSDVNGGYKLYLGKEKLSTMVTAYDAEITYDLIPCKRCGFYIESTIRHLNSPEEIKRMAEKKDKENQKINDENIIRNIIE